MQWLSAAAARLNRLPAIRIAVQSLWSAQEAAAGWRRCEEFFRRIEEIFRGKIWCCCLFRRFWYCHLFRRFCLPAALDNIENECRTSPSMAARDRRFYVDQSPQQEKVLLKKAKRHLQLNKQMAFPSIDVHLRVLIRITCKTGGLCFWITSNNFNFENDFNLEKLKLFEEHFAHAMYIIFLLHALHVITCITHNYMHPAGLGDCGFSYPFVVHLVHWHHCFTQQTSSIYMRSFVPALPHGWWANYCPIWPRGPISIKCALLSKLEQYCVPDLEADDRMTKAETCRLYELAPKPRLFVSPNAAPSQPYWAWLPWSVRETRHDSIQNARPHAGILSRRKVWFGCG